MGQDFSSMCSCFDSQLEHKTEVELPRVLENNFIHDHHIESTPCTEILGFDRSFIQSRIGEVTEKFLELINEGIVGYDTIVEKDTCKVYSKSASEGYILKYTWKIPYTPQQFMDFMDKIEIRKSWDKNIEAIQPIGNYGGNEEILLTRYKTYLTFEPRETLAYTKVVDLNGVLAHVTFSVESDLYPVPPKTVRVQLFVAGTYAEKIEPDELGNICKVTCLSHMEVGLPKAFNDIARKFAGNTIPPITKKIVSELQKYYAE